MRREVGIGQGVGERVEVVLERLATCDHGEAGSIPRSFGCVQRQLLSPSFWVNALRPGVFCVAPWTTDITAGEPDEERTSAGVVAFTLQRMKGFHNGIQSEPGWMRFGGQSFNRSCDLRIKQGSGNSIAGVLCCGAHGD